MLNPTEEPLPGSEPSKKQCKHENLLVVPSNGKRICEDCGYIIQGFKKSSEPAKQPTGILKEKVKLRKTLPAHIRGKKLVDKIEKYFGLKWFRYKDAKGIFDKTDHNNFFILVNAGIFKHIGSQYILRSAKMSSQYILERLENVKKEEVRKETIKAAIFLLENEGFKITKP